jgi:hypothetical protein
VVAPPGNAVRAGKDAQVRFQVLDAATRKPIAGLTDLRVLVFLQPGVWQTREAAVELDSGIYAFQFTPPSDGIYQAHFHSPSLGLKFNSPHRITLAAGASTPAAPSNSTKN